MTGTADAPPPCQEYKTKSLHDSSLTEDVLQRAKEELNETGETISMGLNELKNLIKGEKNLHADTSEEFLLRFLRARKFVPLAAFGMLKNYYRHRVWYPTLFEDYTPGKQIKVMSANLCNFLPWRMLDDSAVWAARVGSWDPKDFTVEALLKFGLMCHEKALQNPVTQICGITTIVDFQGFSWTHFLQTSPSFIRCFVGVSQESFPIRHKAVHVINNPSLFGLLFAIIKPFVSRKIRKRIHIHGYNLSSLHKHVNPSLLPQEFGGTRGPFENKQFYESMLQSEDEFLEIQKYGYEISKDR